MKKLIVAVAAATSLFLGSAFAGNWAHATYSGNYGDSAVIPSVATATQILQSYGGIVTNSGPLGYYVTNNPSAGQLQYNGTISAGSYWIYHQVASGSGYTVTTISW